MKTIVKSLFVFSLAVFGASTTVVGQDGTSHWLESDSLNAPLSGKEVPASRVDMQQSFAPVVRSAAPAVVNVYTSKLVRSRRSSIFDNDPFFRHFFEREGFGMPNTRVQNALGSGVIVRDTGVVITNNHVVAGADKLRIVLNDKREFDATLMLADERTDLAVLQIEDVDTVLPHLEFSHTRFLEIGDLVLAIGNPFGVGQTVTSGIISALARTDVGVSDYAFFIQTDAAINPGNSGGALVDMDGRLVGINTAIFSRSGGSNGIGFAIPAEMVERVVEAAISDGKIIRPWLGLKGQAVTADIAEAIELDRPVGLLISDIYPEGPADLARLRRGDVVLEIDGREISDQRGLSFVAATARSGDILPIKYLRGAKSSITSIRLALPPGDIEASPRFFEGRNPFAGLGVLALSPALAESLGGDPFLEGVIVSEVRPRSLAARTGFRPGDIIRTVNDIEIERIKELDNLIATEPGLWRFSVERRGRIINGSARY